MDVDWFFKRNLTFLLFGTIIGIIMLSLKSVGQFHLLKSPKRALRYGRTDLNKRLGLFRLKKERV